MSQSCCAASKSGWKCLRSIQFPWAISRMRSSSSPVWRACSTRFIVLFFACGIGILYVICDWLTGGNGVCRYRSLPSVFVGWTRGTVVNPVFFCPGCFLILLVNWVMSLCFFGLPGPLLTVGLVFIPGINRFTLSLCTFAMNLSSLSRFGIGSELTWFWMSSFVVVLCLFFVVVWDTAGESGVAIFLGLPRRRFLVVDVIFFWFFVSCLPYLSANCFRWLMLRAPSDSIRLMSRNMASSCGCVSRASCSGDIAAVNWSTCSSDKFPIHTRPGSVVSWSSDNTALPIIWCVFLALS